MFKLVIQKQTHLDIELLSKCMIILVLQILLKWAEQRFCLWKNVKQVIKLLFSLRHEYKYSKLTDNFEENKLYWKKGDSFLDVCCVCLEPNILLTEKCRHCLCRLCFTKIKFITEDNDDDDDDDDYKLCPLCRKSIT